MRCNKGGEKRTRVVTNSKGGEKRTRVVTNGKGGEKRAREVTNGGNSGFASRCQQVVRRIRSGFGLW